MFRIAQQGKLHDFLPRIGSDSLQQIAKMLGHALDRRTVKQIGAVFKHAFQSVVRSFNHRQSQIELGRLVERDFIGRNRQCLAFTHACRHTLHSKKHLKQRRVAQTALDLQLIDQFFKRHIFVGKRIERRLAHATQQFHKRRIIG